MLIRYQIWIYFKEYNAAVAAARNSKICRNSGAQLLKHLRYIDRRAAAAVKQHAGNNKKKKNLCYIYEKELYSVHLLCGVVYKQHERDAAYII